MSSTQLIRISGIALVVGAVVFIVHLLARSVIMAGVDPARAARDGVWVLINAVGVIGAALVLLGLPALSARIARATGWPALAGVVLIAIAWLFFGVFLSLYGALVAPWLAAEAPALVAAAPLPIGIISAFIIALVAELVGSMLLAVPFVRGHVHPRWVGYLLPAAALLTVVGNLIAPSGPASNLALNLLSNLGSMLFLVGLGYLGSRMWAEPAPAARLA